MLRALILSFLLLPWQMLFAVAPAQADTRTAVIIGDSQAQGLRRPLTAALAGYDINVLDAAAHQGKGLKWFLDNDIISNLVSSRRPDMVILIIGGNDNVRVNGRIEGVSRETYEERLRTAYTQAAGSGRSVVWIGPATSQDSGVQARHEATRIVQQAVVPGLGARWIDGMPGSAPGPFQGDSNPSQRSHLTGEGYRRWACLLAPQVSGGGTSTSCPTTADPDQEFPPAVADPESETSAGLEGGFTGTTCDPAGAGVLPVHLGVSVGGVTEVMGLGEYINVFYRYLAGISLIVAIVMVVYGGFRYLLGATSGEIGRGKEIIRDALLGMILVLGAYAILNTFNPDTVNLRSPVLPSIQCLELPATAVSNRCTNDASCGTGRRCVEVDTVWSAPDYEEAAQDAGSGAIGLGAVGCLTGVGCLPAALVGGAGGFLYGYFNSISTPIMQCTDGTLGSPCGDSEHCSGGVCADGFNVCIPPTGNPLGSPCNDNGNCASGICDGEDGYRQCKGDVPIMTMSIYSGAGYRVPDEYVCFTNDDCRDAGGLCQGPTNSPRHFCVPRQTETPELGAPCYAFNGAVQPPLCNGFGDAAYNCMVCPPSGSRVWERISPRNDPDQARLGSCRPTSDAGSPCAGTAR
ncbi:hypothetical protein IT407_01385 [Candidatus Uhrbacteria bacterium]|nr:hypothetical protein [Candidatus Uhrbacteria bacterium]